MTSRALVLGSGGVSAISWQLGILTGLKKQGLELDKVDLFVGTSAGATVAAQVSSGAPLDKIFRRQLDPKVSKEILPAVEPSALRRSYVLARRGAKGKRDARARLGHLALETPTISPRKRRSIIAARLPVKRWPDRPLLITAVDANDGSTVIFDRSSGVTLTDAVAASSAVPGLWPPVLIANRWYIDGSVRSSTNADLANGLDRVLIIAPGSGAGVPQGLASQVKRLERHSYVHVISADDESLVAMGDNRHDPANMRGAANSGLTQGLDVADVVLDFWE